MASKDVEQMAVEEGGGGDPELVLAMVTSPSLSSSDTGAILLGLSLLLYMSCTCTGHFVVAAS